VGVEVARIALSLEYDGSKFFGWQFQNGLLTIQGAVEQALSSVADEPIQVICAGRTDTGVHASHQVIHFDTNKKRSLRAWIQGTNAYLPKEIVVNNGSEQDENFHARYSAVSRRYRYIIYNSPQRPGLYRNYLTWYFKPLDHTLMQTAANSLLGENDFTSFRAAECQSKTPMRCIQHLKVNRYGDLVIIDIAANAFLHHMVRNIAGVLMLVGSEKKPVTWVAEILSAKDRRLGAETAPPNGLYLVAVTYDEKYNLPSNNVGPLILKGFNI
jgi:tRNA pseudouridine38-40 synthase